MSGDSLATVLIVLIMFSYFGFLAWLESRPESNDKDDDAN